MKRPPAVLIIIVGLIIGIAAGATPVAVAEPQPDAAPAAADFENPVAESAPASFADPSVIRGRDGYWYAYTTSKLITIQRSRDLITWEPAGTVFNEANRPDWFRETTGIWAPDISWLDGRYVITFSAIDAAIAPNPNRSIGVASAPTPTGPWQADPAPVIPPGTWQPFPDQPARMQGIIDSELFAAPDGRRYLYYGGFGGGVFVQEVDRQVRQRIGDPVQVIREDAFEAPFLVRRDGWYWLFFSTGHCCLVPNSGYTVSVARSKSPTGPFVDRTGARTDAPYPGGTPVLTPNGNAWTGTGHSTQATDAAGQDWLVYHALDRHRSAPLVRSMYLDRLDWIDGWPVVRAGQFASEGPTPGPIPAAFADAVEGVTEPSAELWADRSGWTVGREEAGGYLHAEPADAGLLLARRRFGPEPRARAAFRVTGDAAAGFVVGARGDDPGVRVRLDAKRHAVIIEAEGKQAEAALPAAVDLGGWHELDVRVDGRTVIAEVTEAGLHDPLARAELDLANALRGGTLGILAESGEVDVDDVTVADLAAPVTERVAEPKAGAELPGAAEEFDGPLGNDWSWVRDPAATVGDGALTFPVQSGDLTGTTNSASVLLRDVPAGDWIVETKLSLDLHDQLDPRFPQAGLVIYRGDDDFLRLAVRGHARTALTEFGKESVPVATPTFGSVLNLGAAAPTTWLPLARRIDPGTGEELYRAGVSRDGDTWTWGLTYPMPAGIAPRLGLIAHGGDNAQPATFDYLRWYAAG
ncbi:family 43 glycosylhydrolase [Microlunatus sp. GCM10028923]|uniref:family 43 glycosylhydrolase n=1 Tax=Microlunatus sp. GCM10028923 TaxID=3273400 RepID=UPI00360BFADB